jgi:hypothetical protein
MSLKVHTHHISEMSNIYKREIGLQISVPAMNLMEDKSNLLHPLANMYVGHAH